MRKNLFISEDKYFINKSQSIKESNDKNKIKKIPCLYIFLSIIFIILIINLYYTIDLHKNQS